MFISFIRALILYCLLILTVRMMGKRQVAEMEPSEFVVAMVLADLASVPMQDNALPLFSGVIPILTVLALELIFAVLTVKFIPIRAFFCGKPVFLIFNGKLEQKNLRDCRISLDELTEKLREKNIFNLSSVRYAIMETDGEISVLLDAAQKPASAKDAGITATNEQLPYTIVSDGRLMRDNLERAGYDEDWLSGELRKLNCKRKELFLFTVDTAGKTCAIRREKK